MHAISQHILHTNVKTALAEDLGSGDVSAHLLPDDLIWHADVVSNENAILCGQAWFDAAFHQLDALERGNATAIDWHVNDGQRFNKGDKVCSLHGLARTLLSAERTALNFLQTLSGTATQTQHYVQLLKGTSARLLDTRKTLPGLRQAQKYAVRCGGGHNHRFGLYDAIMLKENHLQALGSIDKALAAAKAQHPTLKTIVEVETLDELQQALEQRADHVLLDNFTLETLQTAVKLTAQFAKKHSEKRCQLEASGNIEQRTIQAVAHTDVDFISLGTLTKNLQSIDFSMRFIVDTT